ncbi:MAG: hypothetical protein FWH11_03835 [Micrococcales bacterium]|nr:hypothetical protein [Micrococcales bacterium]
MTKVARSAVHARGWTRLAVAATTAALLTGACTERAPIAAPGTATQTATADGRLFPLVRDTASADGTTVRRVGFVDQSGRVVVRPTYRAHRLCPATDGTDVLLAWGDGQLDALDATGEAIGTLTDTETSPETSLNVTTVTCGPLPGYATAGTEQGPSVVTLPDLAPSDLPPGIALDAAVVWVPATEQGGRTTAPYLHDATTGTTTRLPDDVASLVLADGHQAGTGGWPVPVLDTRGMQRYLDQTGSWASTQTFTRAGGLVDGYGWVSTGPSWYFVDTTLTRTGRDWTGIVPLLATDGSVTGYQVTSAAGGTSTGLVTVGLEVVVDPGTESAVCNESTAGSTKVRTCVASAADGTARLVTLPEGTSTPLPTGMTTALSDRLFTDATGSTVHNLTTGQTFDVPAPYRAATAWADAYVQVVSDNGLRMVLDGSGGATGLGTITGQVVAADGTVYFWATTKNRRGYVDAAGDWLYDEARYTVLED